MACGPATTVYVLTYCRNPETLYGSTLLFRTLRTGFPTAAVEVYDNASVPAAVEQIRDLCAASGCAFAPLPRAASHPAFIELMLTRTRAERAVFLDPDIVFWADCEGIRLPEGALFGGRHVPTFRDEYTRTVTLERLHSSFLVFERIDELRRRAAELIRRHIGFAPFAQTCLHLGGRWYRFDTGASLYAAFRPAAYHFGPAELERYDHLLLGAQIDRMHSIHPEDWEVITEHHRAARLGDLAKLKGIYRFQEDYFGRRRVPDHEVPWLAGIGGER